MAITDEKEAALHPWQCPIALPGAGNAPAALPIHTCTRLACSDQSAQCNGCACIGTLKVLPPRRFGAPMFASAVLSASQEESGIAKLAAFKRSRNLAEG